MASQKNGNKPTGHEFSTKKKTQEKTKSNLKIDDSKPYPRKVAKTKIKNGETKLITSASNSSNRAHRHRSSPWPRQSDWRSE